MRNRARGTLAAVKVGDIANPDAAPYGKPLDGVRVLALEQMQAVPYGTQLLARLGADVVKVEAPGGGESGRGAQPSVPDPYGRSMGATFLRNNLGKRSVAIDLKTDAGRDLVRRLAPRFDVLAENFKPGTLARLGLDYETIAPLAPRLVYVSVTGFGNGGVPLRRLAGVRGDRGVDVGDLRVHAPRERGPARRPRRRAR